MIPTSILFGFLVGLLPRPWYFVGIVVAAAAWPLLFVMAGAAIDVQNMAGEFAIALVNAAVGAVVARLLKNLAIMVRG